LKEATPAFSWFKDKLPALQRESVCRVLEFEQGPGEMVFVPDNYFHAVLNLEPGVAASKQLGLSTWPDGFPSSLYGTPAQASAPSAEGEEGKIRTTEASSKSSKSKSKSRKDRFESDFGKKQGRN
jgi:hypothetical protein